MIVYDHLDGRDVADGELLPLPDELLGLERQVPVREDHVIGVGDAGVGREAEGGEDGLAAAPVARERVCPVQAHGAVDLRFGETLRQAQVVSAKFNFKAFYTKLIYEYLI